MSECKSFCLKVLKEKFFEEELTMLKKRYADDINMDKLATQLYLFPGIAEGKNYSAADMNIMDISRLMQSLTPAERIRSDVPCKVDFASAGN